MTRFIGGSIGCMIFAVMCLTPLSAMAQDATVNAKPPLKFAATVHARAIHIPASILDIWFEQHANTWENGQSNMAYGAEFGWRNQDKEGGGYELAVSIDWANLSMTDAFWKEEGEPDTAAKYTAVDLQVLSLTFSSSWYWDVTRWFSPYLTAGIGAGIILGDIIKYRPRQGSQCQGQLGGGTEPFRPPGCFDENGEPRKDQIDFDSPENEDNLLPVIPVVHMAAGARFNIYDYGVVKLELGMHDYLYAGLSLGGQF